MAALDFSSLKAYVGGGAPRALSSGSVLLDVEHSLIAQRFVEIPFDVHWTVDEVKQKVYQLCGTQPDYQQLHLGGAQGPLLAPNTAPLSSFGVTGGPASSSPRLLYVRDVDPYALGRNGALHDVSQVQKYVMSDEEYGRRGNTYRAFKQKQREADPTWRSIYEKKAAPHKGGEEQREAVSAETEAELVSRIPLHCRCQVTPGERRGTVQCQRTDTKDISQGRARRTLRPLSRFTYSSPVLPVCRMQM